MNSKVAQLLTSNDVDHHLAAQQIIFYMRAKQAAISINDKEETRRCLDAIALLTKGYGPAVLKQADAEYNE